MSTYQIAEHVYGETGPETPYPKPRRKQTKDRTLSGHFDDGLYPLDAAKEGAFRAGWAKAIDLASRWHGAPDAAAIAAAAEARWNYRCAVRLIRDGVYVYPPGHAIEAARLRGFHHALVFSAECVGTSRWQEWLDAARAWITSRELTPPAFYRSGVY